MTTEDVKFYDDPVEVACTLSDRELAARREGEIAELMAGAEGTSELEDGYEVRYPGSAGWVRRLAEFVAFERECCAFLTFELRFEHNQGPITLRMRGPEGTKDFLRDMMQG